jgi:acyl-CoA synthetase (AMP-forming)/AMP-acid ligase II
VDATNQSASKPAILHGPPLEQEHDGPLTLPAYLRTVTQMYAPREVLVFREEARIVRWTYAELWERAMQVARALLALDCGKDTRIGILMTNRPEWLAAVFGASIAGCVAVPLNTFSTEPELDYLLNTSAVSVLLAERHVAKKDFAAMLIALDPLLRSSATRSLRFPHLRHLALIGEVPAGSAFSSWQTFLDRAVCIPPELALRTADAVRPTDSGAILFSSGSTATPKGIVNSQRGIAIPLWRWRRLSALHGEVRCWTPNGFFWSGNFACALGATLTAGGCLLLQSIFDPAEALDLMTRERVTFPYAWPHQWKRVMEASNWGSSDLSSVHYLDPDQPLSSHPSIHLKGWREPSFSYGSTETFTITTGYPADARREIMQGAHGYALGGNTIKIVDPVSGELLMRGEHGEIAVKGPTLMIGYLGVPPEVAFDANGFYRTGDSGWIDELDRLHFEGRLSTVIKTGGANVSPLEVDAVLESFAGVKLARCVGVPDDALGERIVACVVPAENAEVLPERLRAFAATKLASYKLPRQFLFLAESELQQTASAKIKPAELRDLALRKLAETTAPS